MELAETANLQSKSATTEIKSFRQQQSWPCQHDWHLCYKLLQQKKTDPPTEKGRERRRERKIARAAKLLFIRTPDPSACKTIASLNWSIHN
jgi:hypothetical protein